MRSPLGDKHSRPISRLRWRHRRARRRCMYRSCRSTTGPASIIGGNVGAGWNSTGSITDNLTPASTFGTTTNTSFLGGGQVGVNYEFGGGVVVGAEAMFDWLPNTKNTINATNGRTILGRRNDQQSLADDRDRQARLRLGSRAALRQGRWRLGRHQQSIDLRSIGAPERLVRHQQQQQLRLDRRSRRRMGFRGQLVGARRVRLRPADRTRASRSHGTPRIRRRRDQRQQSQHQHVHRRPELQVRRRLVVTARTYFLPRLGLPQAPGSTRGFFLCRNFLGTNMNLEPT